MTASRFLLIAALLAAWPVAAQATKRGAPDPSNAAIFCAGPYALCIKAACTPQADAKGGARGVRAAAQAWQASFESMARLMPSLRSARSYLRSMSLPKISS